MSQKAILKEIQRRVKAAKAAETRPKFELSKYFFPKQFEFFRGTDKRFKVAVCSRRAGKTIGIIGDVLDLCLSSPKINTLYVTLTRENCVEIIWPDLLSTIEQYEIPCKINHQRLSVTFTNGSKFTCAGAKDKREVGKFRGRRYHRIYIDEAQNFPSYIQDMIEADMIPTLRDYRGSMLVTGTPGPLKRGFFYGISTNGNWESHTWTAFQNPHMHNPAAGKDLEQTLAEERQVRNIDKNDPTYIRETYGIWQEDRDSLVFKFNRNKNIYQSLPNDLTYIFGIDLGYNDADAIAVLGYSNSTCKVYLVEEYVERGKDVTELAAKIGQLQDKYKPVKMVMDAGALGKKIQEEIRRRHQIPVEAADKHRKFEYIKLLNDDLNTSKLQTLKNSLFEEDCYLVQWDRDVEDPTKIKISKSYHSDITDAVLYGWRECNHYIQHIEPTTFKANSPEWLEHHEQLEMDEFAKSRASDDSEVDQSDLDFVFSDT